MRKFPRFLILLLTIAAVAASQLGCNEHSNSKKDTAEGRAATIAVFYPNNIGDSIQSIFNSTHWAADSNLIRFEENLPQSDAAYFESLFDFELHESKSLADTDPSNGIKLQSAPLIWIVDPNGNYSDIHSGKKRSVARNGNEQRILLDTTFDKIHCVWVANVWALPQVVLFIEDSQFKGKNLNTKWFSKQQHALCTITKQQELLMHGKFSNLTRHSSLTQNNYSDSLSKLIEGKYNIIPMISAEMKLVLANNDFVWFRNENSQYHSNIMINIYPINSHGWTVYPPLSVLSKVNLNVTTDFKSAVVFKRNEVSKKYLRTAEGTWVAISESGMFPIRFWPNNKSNESYLTGWYTELNTDRRGPFVRRIITDKKNQRIIAVDGFLFAPNQPRLHLMREIEIMVQQFQIKS